MTTDGAALTAEPDAARWARPLRALIIVPWGERQGGAENYLLTFCRHADRAAVDIHVVFLVPGSFPAELRALGVRTTVLDAGRLRQAGRLGATVLRLARLMRRERPDVILNWTVKSQLYGGPAAGLAGMGRRNLFWPREIPERTWFYQSATLLPAGGVICSARNVAAAQARLRPRHPTTVVHPGVEPSAPMPAAERAAFRRDLGIPDSALVVGILARLQRWKGHHHFLAAVTAVGERNPHVWALVVGGNAFGLEPGYEEELHAMATESSMGDRILFTGQVPGGSRYVQAMDVMVNASGAEPFGIVLLEAMSQGVPVVAFANAGPLEIVEDGVSGVLVPRGDVPALAGAIQRLAADPDHRAAIGEGGRRRFDDRFTAARMVDELTSALQRAARMPPAPRTW